MSSAKRVWPVTFARASTLRRGTPITRSSSPLVFGVSTGIPRESFASGMRPPECLHEPWPRHLRYRTLLVGDLEHRGFTSLEHLNIARPPAYISVHPFPTPIAAAPS